MGRAPKALRAVADGLYTPAPSASMVAQFGGVPDDYLPTIEVPEAIGREFDLFAALDTQWNVTSFGVPIGIRYDVVKIMAPAYGLKFDRDLIDDIRTMESAAIERMKETARRNQANG